MGLDGDADHDDYGLPPVDIVVPDDARELDRDLLAYHRELRQRRHRERRHRLVRPFTRYGVAAPFIAGAVLVALISGLLMTVVAPRPAPPGDLASAGARPRPQPGQVGGPLPDAYLDIGGTRTHLVGLGPGVIAIVPHDCHCARAVRSISTQARGRHLRVWLVADRRPAGDAADVHRLADKAAHGHATVIEDPDGVLSSTYDVSGLTALLVRTDGTVGEVVQHVRPTWDLTAHLAPLKDPGASPGVSPSW